MKSLIKFISMFALTAALAACSPATVENNITATNPPADEVPAATTDSIELISIIPLADAGFHRTDTAITAVVQVNLVTAPGNINLWLERFHDAACTQVGYDQGMNSTMTSSDPLPVALGSQQVTLTVAVPPLDVEYVGIGFLVRGLDSSTIVTQNSYPVCYKVFP